MNLNNHTFLIICILSTFLFTHCKNENQKSDRTGKPKEIITVPSNDKNQDANNDAFLIKTPPGYYQPHGLRPLNLIESFELGKSRPFSNSCPLKDKFGKQISWDTLLHSPVPLFLQMYVNENNQLVEGVVFETNDTIQGLIMRVRIAKSGN